MIMTKQLVELLNKLMPTGYFFVTYSDYNTMRIIRRLKYEGHPIEVYSTFRSYCTSRENIPKFRVIFYPDKRQEVVDEIYRRYPTLKGRPQIHRRIDVPILKNLHTLATRSTENRKRSQRSYLKKWNIRNPDYAKNYRKAHNEKKRQI